MVQVQRRKNTFNPLQKQVLNSSELKEFADDNLKLEENGGKFSQRVENTVEKEAISPFSTVLSKDVYCRHVKTSACLGKDLIAVILDKNHAFLRSCSALLGRAGLDLDYLPPYNTFYHITTLVSNVI